MKQITKLFLPLLLSFDCLYASEQLIVIVSKDFNTSYGVLTTYEKEGVLYEKKGESIPVNLGRNGLAWGIGLPLFHPKKEEPIKREGDGRAPAGLFKISKAFGYAKEIETKMPYLYADKNLICVDDSTSTDYNKVIELDQSKTPKSFEWMHRKDPLYKIGLIVDHNTQGLAGAGSCIFFHIQKGEHAPTAGCSAMREAPLRKIIKWLDPAKEPQVLQIPQPYCQEAMQHFKGISCSH